MCAKMKMPGVAIDLSEKAVASTTERIRKYEADIDVIKKDFFELADSDIYGIILMFDVLEHIEQDELAVDKLRTLLRKKGYLLVSFPVKMKEWRWDDDYYGHFRRYENAEIKKMFDNEHFRIVYQWDITFPFIFVTRRLYTRIFAGEKTNLQAVERTKNSAFTSAAGNGAIMKVVESIPIWPFLFCIQNLFRHKNYGCNTLLLVQKNN
jgi:SAM-dependent methyltransferase